MHETANSFTLHYRPDVYGIDDIGHASQELLAEDRLSLVAKKSGEMALTAMMSSGSEGGTVGAVSPIETQSTMELRNHLDPRNMATVKIIESGVGEVTNLIASSDPQKSLLERKFGKNAHETLELIRQDTLSRIAKPMSERSGTGVIIEGEAELRRPIMDITLDDETSKVVADQLSKRKTGMVEVQKALNELLAGDTTDKKTFDVKLQSIINHKNGLLVRCGVQPREFGEHIEGLNQRGNVADLYISENDMLEYDKLDELVAKATDLVYGKIDRPSSRDNIAARITQMATVTFPSGVEFMHRTPIETFPMIAQQNQLSTRSTTLHGSDRKLQNNGAFLHFTPPGTSAEEYGAVAFGVPIDTIYKHSPRLHLEDAYHNNSFYHEGASWSTQEVLGRFTINHPSNEKHTPLAFRVALTNMQEQISKGIQPIDIGQGRYDNFGFAATNNEKTAGLYAYPLEELHIYSDNPTEIDTALKGLPHADSIYRRVGSIVAMDEEGRFLPRGERYAVLPNFELGNSQLVVYAPVNFDAVPFTESSMSDNDPGKSSLPINPDTINRVAYPKFATELIGAGYDIDGVLDSVAEVVNEGGPYSVDDILEAYTKNRELFLVANKDITEVINRFEAVGVLNVLYKIKSEKQNSLIHALNDNGSAESNKTESGMTKDELARLVLGAADRLKMMDLDEFYRSADALESAGYEFSPSERLGLEEFNKKARDISEERQKALAEQDWLF